MRGILHSILLFPVALGAAACGARDTTPARIHVDSLPALVATVEQRYGNVESPDSGFTLIGAVDIDRDGNIYVFEARDREIRVYAPDFRMLRTIGRAGQGPGEFTGSTRFGVVGDTVWTISSADGLAVDKIALFSRDGALLSTSSVKAVRVELPGSWGYVHPTRMRPDGRFSSNLTAIGSHVDDPPSTVKPTDSIPVPRVLFSPSGAVVDTLGWDDKPPPRMWRAPGMYDQNGRLQFLRINDIPYLVPDPPTATPEWYSLHDAKIIVETPQPLDAANASFTVTRLALSSDTVYHRTLLYSPLEYQEAALDSIALRASAGSNMAIVAGGQASRPGPNPAIASQLREKMNFPRYKLPLQYAWLAQDESIWLPRNHADPSTKRWIILDANGDLEGELQLAPRVRPLWRNGDVLWVTEPDDMDVPWLVKYRIGGRDGR